MKRFLFTLVLVSLTGQFCWADIPKTMNYQGRLTDSLGNVLADGTYSVAFRLWTHPTSTDEGTYRVWNDTYDVQTKSGYFSVELGSGTNKLDSLDFNTTYYLDMKVGTDDYMTPRHKLNAAAYAMNIADSAITTDKIADGTITGADLNNIAGNRVDSGHIETGAVDTRTIEDAAVTTEKLEDYATSQVWSFGYNSRTHSASETFTVFNENINFEKPCEVVIIVKCEMHGRSATSGNVAWTLYWDGAWDDYAIRGIDNRTSDLGGATLLSHHKIINTGERNIKLETEVVVVDSAIETRFYKMIVQAFYK